MGPTTNNWEESEREDDENIVTVQWLLFCVIGKYGDVLERTNVPFTDYVLNDIILICRKCSHYQLLTDAIFL